MFRHKRVLKRKSSGRYALSKKHKGHSTVDFHLRRLQHGLCNLFQPKTRGKITTIFFILLSISTLTLIIITHNNSNPDEKASPYSNPSIDRIDIRGIGLFERQDNSNVDRDRSILHKSHHGIPNDEIDLSFIDCNIEISSKHNKNDKNELSLSQSDNNSSHNYLSSRYATRISTMLNNFDSLPLKDQSMLLNVSKHINILNPTCVYSINSIIGQRGCIPYDCRYSIDNNDNNSDDNDNDGDDGTNFLPLSLSQIDSSIIKPYRGLILRRENDVRLRGMIKPGVGKGAECYISMKYEFIFIHVLKSGGSSMKGFLRYGLCGGDDLSKCSNILRPINCRVAIRDYSSFFTFTIIRNPFDRAFSIYSHALMNSKIKTGGASVNNDGKGGKNLRGSSKKFDTEENRMKVESFAEFISNVPASLSINRRKVFDFNRIDIENGQSIKNDLSQQILQYILYSTQYEYFSNNKDFIYNNELFLSSTNELSDILQNQEKTNSIFEAFSQKCHNTVTRMKNQKNNVNENNLNSKSNEKNINDNNNYNNNNNNNNNNNAKQQMPKNPLIDKANGHVKRQIDIKNLHHLKRNKRKGNHRRLLTRRDDAMHRIGDLRNRLSDDLVPGDPHKGRENTERQRRKRRRPHVTGADMVRDRDRDRDSDDDRQREIHRQDIWKEFEKNGGLSNGGNLMNMIGNGNGFGGLAGNLENKGVGIDIPSFFNNIQGDKRQGRFIQRSKHNGQGASGGKGGGQGGTGGQSGKGGNGFHGSKPDTKLTGIDSNHFVEQNCFIFDFDYCPKVDYIATLETIDIDILFLLYIINSDELNDYYYNKNRREFWQINTFGVSVKEKILKFSINDYSVDNNGNIIVDNSNGAPNISTIYNTLTDKNGIENAIKWFWDDLILFGIDPNKLEKNAISLHEK